MSTGGPASREPLRRIATVAPAVALIVLTLLLVYRRVASRDVSAQAREALEADARAAFLAHDCKRAVALYTELLAGTPDDPTYYVNRGSCHSDLGQLEAGVADNRKAIEIAERLAGGREPAVLAGFFYNQGVTLGQSGDARGAIAAYERALALDPSYPDAANNMAWAFATSDNDKLRDPKRAVTLAEDECRRSKHENVAHLATLAAAYAAAGDFDKAVATQKKVIERSPDEERAEREGNLAQFEKKQALRLP